MKLKNKTCRQHTFGAIANFVVNSRSRFARNIILVENNQFRSSQPRQAPERYQQGEEKTATPKMTEKMV
jgi:hypothetical protein